MGWREIVWGSLDKKTVDLELGLQFERPVRNQTPCTEWKKRECHWALKGGVCVLVSAAVLWAILEEGSQRAYLQVVDVGVRRRVLLRASYARTLKGLG